MSKRHDDDNYELRYPISIKSVSDLANTVYEY